MTLKRAIIKVFGIVQGVGFRPFIHKLVNEYSFKGWVQNSASGVTIDVEGEEEKLAAFIREIPVKAPELAVIENIAFRYDEVKNYRDFEIIKSGSDEEGFVLVSPDVSICSDCYNELTDPDNKRYRYPFINCTNCGPRFTIIKDLPYDRDKTTMSDFPMCHECNCEYHDISDRRYHAQPNCCPDCGPEIWLCGRDGRRLEGDTVKLAIEKLLEGNILAIKGLGGFHLACNGMDSAAVKKLRDRKRREQKPFAMMCRDIENIRKYADVSEDEQRMLESARRPIVLLEKKKGLSLPNEIAPDNNCLGFMLPYTPLHYLLFEDNRLQVLIMTSANISDDPIIYTNNDAVTGLRNIADYFLLHNREINTRCDDSVVKVVGGREYFVRRSRGYAPFPVKLDIELKPILACGAEQKASFSISRGRYVFISQHIGDLKNYETLMHYEEQIENYKRLFKIQPVVVACDMHPDYLSTNYANEIQLDKVYVQHHHAHMASCMADNNIKDDVIGITWDGTGLGTDDTIWGGEVLVGNYSTFERKGSFLSVPMPGGDRAVKDIYAMTASYIAQVYGTSFSQYIERLPHLRDKIKDQGLLYKIIEQKINSPYTSSCGRLFDGVSGMLGLCTAADYEGQAAVRLETCTDFSITNSLDYDIRKADGLYIYDWRSTIDNIIGLIGKNIDISYISSSFHNTVVEAGAELCMLIREETGLDKVVLSGGVFQNSFILKKLVHRLKSNKFNVYIHNRVSANDEGISLGQLVIAQNGGGLHVPCGTIKNSFNR